MGEETRIVKRIRDAVKAKGGYSIKFHGSPFSAAGVPDMVVIIKGQSIWMEVKTATGKQSKIQKYMQLMFRLRGVEVYVVRSVEEALDAVLHESGV